MQLEKLHRLSRNELEELALAQAMELDELRIKLSKIPILKIAPSMREELHTEKSAGALIKETLSK